MCKAAAIAILIFVNIFPSNANLQVDKRPAILLWMVIVSHWLSLRFLYLNHVKLKLKQGISAVLFKIKKYLKSVL